MIGDKLHARLLNHGWTWDGHDYTLELHFHALRLLPVNARDSFDTELQRRGPWIVWTCHPANGSFVRIGYAVRFVDLEVFANGLK